MFSKAVLTFLAIGALWLNVSAIPVFYSKEGRPSSTSSPTGSNSDSPGSRFSEYSNPGLNVDPPPQPRRKKWVMPAGELPRSFSALSYRHLTFIFSVVGGTIIAAAIGGGVGGSLVRHKNHTRREFGLESEGSNSVPSLLVLKREPMPEDEASDSLSSPLEHDPEPAPPSL